MHCKFTAAKYQVDSYSTSLFINIKWLQSRDIIYIETFEYWEPLWICYILYYKVSHSFKSSTSSWESRDKEQGRKITYPAPNLATSPAGETESGTTINDYNSAAPQWQHIQLWDMVCGYVQLKRQGTKLNMTANHIPKPYPKVKRGYSWRSSLVLILV